jgi:hypothetical protein
VNLEDGTQIKPGIITFIDNRENLQELEISSLLMLKLKESLSMKSSIGSGGKQFKEW